MRRFSSLTIPETLAILLFNGYFSLNASYTVFYLEAWTNVLKYALKSQCRLKTTITLKEILELNLPNLFIATNEETDSHGGLQICSGLNSILINEEPIIY